MQRVPRRRLLAALLASLSLMAVAIPQIVGVASAATASFTCPAPEGGFQLCISAPESVLTNTPFTVQVGVTTDGKTAVNNDPCASKVGVTLEIPQEGPPLYSQTANAAAGIATFNVTIPNDAFYQFHAFVGEGVCGGTIFDDWFGFTSVTVPDGEALAPCPDNVKCVQVIGGSGTNATLIGNAGTSFTPLFAGVTDYFSTFAASDFPPGCGPDPNPTNRDVLGYTHQDGGPQTIIFALSSALVTKGIGLFNVCWNSATPFTQLGGGSGTTGLLPDCKKLDVGPCVLFRKSNKGNVGFFGVLVPEGDPKGTLR
jgi:hypothetical protein